MRDANAYSRSPGSSVSVRTPSTSSRSGTGKSRALAMRSNSPIIRSSSTSNWLALTGFPGLSRHSSTAPPRVRVVGQPLAHLDPFGRPAPQQEPARVGGLDAFGDPGHRPDVAAHVTATDLTALRDQHHTEPRVVVAHTVTHQLGITRLEDLPRQILA